MSYRTKARKFANNDREYKLYSLQCYGKCTWCPPHDGDNVQFRKSYSQWGKKVAAKTAYSSGKKRKEVPKHLRQWWFDKHYANKNKLNTHWYW